MPLKRSSKGSKTINHIRSVYVKDQSAAVSGGEITEYRVNLKLTFELE
jgi:flavin-binding protein dodecin